MSENEKREPREWYGSPTKLSDGTWGARIPTRVPADVCIEDYVHIKTRTGKQWRADVTSVVSRHDDCVIVETNSNKRGKKMGYRASAKAIGNDCYVCYKPIQIGEIITHARKGGKGYRHADCSESYATPTPEAKPEATIPDSAPSVPMSGDSKSQGMAALAAMLKPHLGAATHDTLQKLVREATSEERISSLVQRHTTRVVIDLTTREEKKEIKFEHTHPQFKELLNVFKLGLIPYLYGPPGWGKSTSLEQVAKALGMRYGHLSIVASMSHVMLTGYGNAAGEYVATEFHDYWSKGGLYSLEELDHASANLVTVMNPALANSVFSFPIVGQVTRHDDCLLAACGNTMMRGGNANYPEARRMSAATRDRFAFIEWRPDQNFERSIAMSYSEHAGPWVNWVQAIRKEADKRGSGELLVTPRATYSGIKLLKSGFTPHQTASMVVYRGATKSEVDSLLAVVGQPTGLAEVR